MSMNLDRNIMSWIDIFIEENTNYLNINNFECSMIDISNKEKLIQINKLKNKYWKLEFYVENSYIIKLKQNVNNKYKEYIYKEISIKMDENIYSIINNYIIKIFELVTEQLYSVKTHQTYLLHSEAFIKACKGLSFEKKISLDNNILFVVKNTSEVVFESVNKDFKLTLFFNDENDEDILDSLIDLRKSIIIDDLRR